MITNFAIPAQRHRVIATVRRSRFIATAAHAPDGASAHALVAELKQEFPDATHHCWAFVAGPPGSSAQVGMSDAGEPKGTAGRPMLNVLLHSGVGEVAAVVTRYFGGTKLGTGGLVRAYGDSVKQLLATLPLTTHVVRQRVTLRYGYGHSSEIEQLLRQVDHQALHSHYTSRVELTLAIAAKEWPELQRALAHLDGVEVVAD